MLLHARAELHSTYNVSTSLYLTNVSVECAWFVLVFKVCFGFQGLFDVSREIGGQGRKEAICQMTLLNLLQVIILPNATRCTNVCYELLISLFPDHLGVCKEKKSESGSLANHPEVSF